MSLKLFVLARFMHFDVQGLTACFASLHSRLMCDCDSFTKELQIVLHRAPDSHGQKRSRNVARSLCAAFPLQAFDDRHLGRRRGCSRKSKTSNKKKKKEE